MKNRRLAQISPSADLPRTLELRKVWHDRNPALQKPKRKFERNGYAGKSKFSHGIVKKGETH